MTSNSQSLYPPYGHHYRSWLELIKSSTALRLFLWICDEHTMLKNLKKPSLIKRSDRYIAKKAGISRNSLPAALNALQKLGFIVCYDDGAIKLNETIVWSVVKSYREIESDKEKSELFYRAFNADTPDFGCLRNLGYKELNSSEVLSLSELSGSVLNHLAQNCAIDDESGSKLCHYEENEAQNSTINGSILNHFDEDFEKLAQNCAIILSDTYTPRELFADFEYASGSKLCQNEKEDLKSLIFDNNGSKLCHFSTEFIGILMFLGGSKLCNWVAQNCATTGSKLSHINKYINNILNKEKPQIEDLRQKGKDFFEEEEEQETSSLENFEEGQEPDDKLPELDLNLMAERNAQQYKKIKHKQNLPFLPEEDVRRWASDIRECLDRPDKLFLHYLYEIGHRIFDTEEVTDDEGNIITEHNTSIDKWQCYDVRVIPDLLTPAMDSLMEAVKAGKVVVDDKELPVEIKEEDVDPSFVELLIDWDKIPSSLNEGGYLYVITPDKYKNIYAEEVPVVKKERNFEERKKKIDDNNAYLHKLILLAQWEDTYEQLTCLEKTVFNFADTFFQLDDNTLKPVDIKKQSEMSQFRHTALKNSLQRFKMEKLEKPLTWEDFTSIFYGTKIDQNECLYLETRMFDADLIRRYHALHNLHSVVDEQNLDELVEDYNEVEA